MQLISLKNASLAYGLAPLLDKIDFAIEPRERVCIVGRNGEGKSTLLRVLLDSAHLDDGERLVEAGTNVAMLPQDPPRDTTGTVFEYVLGGVPDWQGLLTRYHQLIEQAADADLDELARVQTELEAKGGWDIDTRINKVLTELGLTADQQLTTLSGGWLRRAALARALVVNPDVLLLDEPTNHLDLDAIEWLEQFLQSLDVALVFVSHDRAFIRHMATRIVDLDRGNLTSWPGNYEAYLQGKEKWLEDEARANERFDKKLAEEEKWIRQGIKARRTRNEGRVRNLQKLREERAERRSQQGTARLQVQQSENRGGRRFAELTDIQVDIGGQTLVKDFSALVMREDRIALVGPNGSGKSTLLKALLGKLPLAAGKLWTTPNMEVAYFDQHRTQLDPAKTVEETVGEGKQHVTINGQQRHILGYLQDFLFPPARARTPISVLSGGEKNRLLLAKLFLRPSNVLVLDEPTNDLDVETLELLEELLENYPGTVLLVSHDREFIDKVASACWLFEGHGKVTEIVGGFAEIAHYRQQMAARKATPKKAKTAAMPQDKSKPRKSAAKMSYKLKLELENMPDKISTLESRVTALQQQVSEPDFYNGSHEQTAPVLASLAEAEAELEQAFSRWEWLEEQANQD